MKTDIELLASLSAHLGQLPKGTKAISLRLPIKGITDTAELQRVVAIAEAKWFLENLVQSTGPGGPVWTFDLTARGTEALQLD